MNPAAPIKFFASSEFAGANGKPFAPFCLPAPKDAKIDARAAPAHTQSHAIFEEGALSPDSVVREFRITAADGPPQVFGPGKSNQPLN
jgi:hypothetical protein